jgi:hypothetical protein
VSQIGGVTGRAKQRVRFGIGDDRSGAISRFRKYVALRRPFLRGRRSALAAEFAITFGTELAAARLSAFATDLLIEFTATGLSRRSPASSTSFLDRHSTLTRPALCHDTPRFLRLHLKHIPPWRKHTENRL